MGGRVWDEGLLGIDGSLFHSGLGSLGKEGIRHRHGGDRCCGQWTGAERLLPAGSLEQIVQRILGPFLTLPPSKLQGSHRPQLDRRVSHDALWLLRA